MTSGSGDLLGRLVARRCPVRLRRAWSGEQVADHGAGGRVLPEPSLGIGVASRVEPCDRRSVQVERLEGDLVVEGAHGAEVVQHPERTALGRRHQVPAMDHQVGHRHDRQAEPELLPATPSVPGDPDSRLGSGIEEIAPLRVLPHHAHDEVGRQAAFPSLPALPAVLGQEDTRSRVVPLAPAHRQPDPQRVVRRDLDRVDHRLPHPRRGDAGPARLRRA